MNQRNCLILGSGRSGTSMAAGILAKAGYFMGEEIWPANEGNPKGQFEDREVNQINDQLIASVSSKSPPHVLRRLFYGDAPVLGDLQHWVAVLRPGVPIPCAPAMSGRIAAVTAHQPFCLKDPRFSYTLPAWRPHIGDALLLCVFRDPSVTASSIVRECNTADYMKPLGVDARWGSRCGRRCTAISWKWIIRRAATGFSCTTTSCLIIRRTRNWSIVSGSESIASSRRPSLTVRGRGPRCHAAWPGCTIVYANSLAMRLPAAPRSRHSRITALVSGRLFQHHQHPDGGEPARKRSRDPIFGLEQRGQPAAGQKAVSAEAAA